MMQENLTADEQIAEIYVTMITPPHARGFGRGPLKSLPKKGYKPTINIAIDPRGTLGWQVKDPTAAEGTNPWIDYDYVGIEGTIINVQISETKADEAKNQSSSKKITELEEEIEALASSPALREKKELALAEELFQQENSMVYIYLKLIDRQHQYSIRMRPDNYFTISLFNQLRLVIDQDKALTKREHHKLSNAVTIGIEKRASTKSSTKTISFASVWTIGEVSVWVGETETLTKNDWRPIWKETVMLVGDYVRRLHGQPDYSQANNNQLPAKQTYLPPSKPSKPSSIPKPPKDKFLDLKESVNKAFNEGDQDHLDKVLSSLINNPKAIASLGEFIDEARQYVLEVIGANKEEDEPVEALAEDEPVEDEPDDAVSVEAVLVP